MMNKNKLFLVGTLLIGIVSAPFVFLSCGDPEPVHKDKYTDICNFKMNAPEKVKAYIDASGSMRGYFSKGSDGRFISAISNANADEIVWLDNDFSPIQGSLNMAVLDGSYKGKDSKFDEMITRICEDLHLDSASNLGLLFTDGIISSSKAETDKDPEHTKKSFVVLQNEIIKAIQNKPGLAIAFFYLKSKFAGAYYNYQNKPVNDLLINDRPFYVIAIGKADQVRHFMLNNQLNAGCESWGLYNGIQTTKNDETFIFTPTPKTDWDGDLYKASDAKGTTIKLSLPLPEYICKLGWDYLMQNMKIEFNSQTMGQDAFTLSPINRNGQLEGLEVEFETNKVKCRTAPTLIPKDNKLVLKIVKSNTSGAYDTMGCEDDLDIKKDSMLQIQTFGLNYLRTGLRKGVNEDDTVVIFSTQYSFDKN